ncbi:mitochondrial import receptor subunit TOM20 homolog [Armigeres subalbatus]|uniref:mitochondrial import receptor subunit TOM20 homolog n=1 Tax=Armigeres subalbatus TaxID=124917 RepID=UPI002ED0D66D
MKISKTIDEYVNGKTTIGIAAGVTGTLFLGYCIYFDHKPRKDPDFKKKLRVRRLEREIRGEKKENFFAFRPLSRSELTCYPNKKYSRITIQLHFYSGSATVKLGSGIVEMEISKTTIGIAAGVAGTLFLGYCIYFDHNARIFLQEIQMGEALISSGDIENGVEHLANAVIVCGQPAQLLQVLQQTLPAQVFTLLINRMRQ